MSFEGIIATQIIQMGWFFRRLRRLFKMNYGMISLRRLYRRGISPLRWFFRRLHGYFKMSFEGNIAAQIIQMGWFFPQITQIIKMNCRKKSLRRLYRRILALKEMT
jgi:hypothetical protein